VERSAIVDPSQRMTRDDTRSCDSSSQCVEGFAPILGCNPRLLILGSMPSVTSLERGQYYAHPRNAFWPIMDRLGLADATASYGDRLDQLKDAGIGLWDTLRRCERAGSLDVAIVGSTEVAHDFDALFTGLPTLRAVVFNGAKAEQAFRRHVCPTLRRDTSRRLAFLRLPSTSPAHTIPVEMKVAGWRAIRKFLEPS
jgi:double-stranded uracil-DNA glycosylase